MFHLITTRSRTDISTIFEIDGTTQQSPDELVCCREQERKKEGGREREGEKIIIYDVCVCVCVCVCVFGVYYFPYYANHVWSLVVPPRHIQYRYLAMHSYGSSTLYQIHGCIR